MFTYAKPIFIDRRSSETNYTAGFVCRFTAKPDARYRLRVSAASFVRVLLDGRFIHFGPARAPHGWLRVDELEISPDVGVHTLAFEVAGYNCASFYSIKLPSFLCAELYENDSAVAFTGRDFKGISLTSFREQRVPRYSAQRTFTEVYYLDSPCAEWYNGDFIGEELEVVEHGCDYLPRRFALPRFDITAPAKFLRAGKYVVPHRKFDGQNSYIERGFSYDTCPNDIISATADALFTKVDGMNGDALSDGEFAQYVFPHVNSGFIRTSLTATTPSVVYVVFSEMHDGDDIVYGNGTYEFGAVTNVIKYTLPVGSHIIESFECYSFMHVALLVESGNVSLEPFTIREYSYPIRPFEPNTGDKELDLVLCACREGFRQNTVDCFTDCPGRERAGWLCDSYFTAQASLYFTGDLTCEKAYLDNFRIAKYFPYLPEGLLPMCYPGDVLREHTIPQWTMWFVAEVYEFGKRGGDVLPFCEMIMKTFDYFAKFENSDGLLEKLPYWNFIEWTKANKWVQDVSYPTNMLYSYILKLTAEMYGMPELAEKSAKVRRAVIDQSFDGEYFRDHALRREDGSLDVLDDRSAICQHEAFMFDIADDSGRFDRLKDRLINGMGIDGDRSSLVEGLEPLDIFIGYAVRVEVLMKFGCYERNIDEIKRLYGYMARETGTIWEHTAPTASLNHGFGSFVAPKIAECLERTNAR